MLKWMCAHTNHVCDVVGPDGLYISEVTVGALII